MAALCNTTIFKSRPLLTRSRNDPGKRGTAGDCQGASSFRATGRRREDFRPDPGADAGAEETTPIRRPSSGQLCSSSPLPRRKLARRPERLPWIDQAARPHPSLGSVSLATSIAERHPGCRPPGQRSREQCQRPIGQLRGKRQLANRSTRFVAGSSDWLRALRRFARIHQPDRGHEPGRHGFDDVLALEQGQSIHSGAASHPTAGT